MYKCLPSFINILKFLKLYQHKEFIETYETKSALYAYTKLKLNLESKYFVILVKTSNMSV